MTDEELLVEAQRQLSSGHSYQAELLCRRVLATDADHPDALELLGTLCIGQNRASEAETLLRRGARVDAGRLSFHLALAQLLLDQNRFADAVEPVENCVVLRPDQAEYRAALTSLYRNGLFSRFDARSKKALCLCLRDDRLNHSVLNKTWLSLLRHDPDSAQMLELFGSASYSEFSAGADTSFFRAWQGNDYFNSGLNRFVIPDPVLERGLTFARRWFFDHPTEQATFLDLVCLLARYCAFTEYVFPCAEDYAFLRHRTSDHSAVAMLGCYESLAIQPDADGYIALSAAAAFRSLIEAQVLQQRAEESIKATIPAWSTVTDETSRAVQNQYEENPYPRWLNAGAPASSATSDEAVAILVAGCGTGREAIETALRFPNARVCAVDLSRSSLAYAIRKASELNVTHVDFRQADILELPRRGGYDLILASGVLHHMRDPEAGLRALLRHLRPAGTLRLGLYSTLARAPLEEARALIGRAGLEPTLDGIRRFRAELLARPEDDPLRVRVTASADFYTTSSCRDYLFHAHECTFTLLEIDDILRRFDLSLTRMEVPPQLHAAYVTRFPGDPDALSLVNWHAIEQDHPTAFSGMYGLWLALMPA